MSPSKKGDWVTNVVGSIHAYFPRRDAAYSVGPPRPSESASEEYLQSRRIIGVYLDEDIPEGLKSRPLVQRKV